MKHARQAVRDKVRRSADHPTVVPVKVTTTTVTPAIRMPRCDPRFRDWRSLYHSDLHRGRGGRVKAPRSVPPEPIPPRGQAATQSNVTRAPHGWHVLIEIRTLEPPRDRGALVPGGPEELDALTLAWVELTENLRTRGCSIEALQKLDWRIWEG